MKFKVQLKAFEMQRKGLLEMQQHAEPEVHVPKSTGAAFEMCFYEHVSQEAEDLSDKPYLTDSRHAKRALLERHSSAERNLRSQCLLLWHASVLPHTAECG